MLFRACALLAVYALTSVGSNAHADPDETGFYGSVFVEGNLSQPVDSSRLFAEPVPSSDTLLDGGFTVGGALGRSWTGLGEVTPRTELELTYRQGESNALGLNGFGPGGDANFGGDSGATTLTGKVMLDVPLGESVLTPYLGAGVGIKFKDQGFTSGNGHPLDGVGENYSAQVIAGVSHSLAEQLDLTLDGRYQRSLDKGDALSSSSGSESDNDSDLGIFSLFIRLRAKF